MARWGQIRGTKEGPNAIWAVGANAIADTYVARSAASGNSGSAARINIGGVWPAGNYGPLTLYGSPFNPNVVSGGAATATLTAHGQTSQSAREGGREITADRLEMQSDKQQFVLQVAPKDGEAW